MLKFWKKSKPEPQTEQPIQSEEEVKRMEDAKRITLFEEIAEALLDFEVVMKSPINGDLIGMIRTEDVLNSIAITMDVDIADTAFEHYKK